MKTERPYPFVTIDARGTKRAQEGHPWVFDNEITDVYKRQEFLLEHGFVDIIVPRTQQRETIAKLLKLHRKGAAQ